MKTMKLWRLTLMMLVALSLASCEKDRQDGDWDTMVWKTEVPVVKNGGIYDVSDGGETFTFTCSNYSKPWIEGAVSGGEHYYPNRENNDYHTIIADWFKAEIIGNKLTLSFEPNKKSNEQFLSLTVTAGDIFYTFKFKQFAHQQ